MKHIVSFSGGKDSTAMLLMLLEKGWPVDEIRAFDSGWEFPQMYDHYRGRRDCIWYVGLASDEKDRTFKSSSETRSGKRLYPLIDWGITEADALEYCYSKGFTWGGLYKHFKRVSCYCCPLQRIGELRKLRRYYPEQWAQMLEWDRAIPVNRGFRGYDTVADLERYFAYEDAQTEFCFAGVTS